MRQQELLGDQVRKIAEQLQKEKNLQIKSTSQILEAAAQMSENHDRLIDEVFHIMEEDLIQKSPNVYTVEILRNQFGTLKEAKSYFDLKANSWDNLTKKLNLLSSRSTLITGQSTVSILNRLNLIEGEIKVMHAKINQILSFLMQEHS